MRNDKTLIVAVQLFFFLLFTSFICLADDESYIASVTFPAGYTIGDCIEFVSVNPINAGSSGYYEISISYTRLNVAAAATHIASVSHSNPDVWREVGRVNSNVYSVVNGLNFTVDCNTAYGHPRFRIRAVNTWGDNLPIVVNVKVRSINLNASWHPIDYHSKGDVSGYVPMTYEWNLMVGSPFYSDGAKIAIHVDGAGRIGMGTMNVEEQLSVNGKIRAREIRVDNSNWPDYVFEDDYPLRSLNDLEKYIKKFKRLPETPGASSVHQNGTELGEMNAILLKKVEELTLYILQLKKELEKKADR